MTKSVQIFLIILSFVFLTAWSFSQTKITRPDDYKPIPTNLSKQYKQEMEQIIDEEIPKSKKYIDDNIKDAEDLRHKMLLSGYNDTDYFKLTNIVDVCSLAYDINIYKKMAQVTIEKYLGDNYDSYEIFNCGDSYSLSVFMYYYIEDNKINKFPIIKLSYYADKKYKMVEKYINELKSLRLN